MTVEFPKWVYKKDTPPQLVKDAAAEAALGKGWSENPAGTPEQAGAGLNAPAPGPAVPAAYVPQEYPKVLYRKVDGKIESCRVVSAADEAALGKGWSEDTGGEPIPVAAPEPATAEVAPPVPEPVPVKKGRRKKAA